MEFILVVVIIIVICLIFNVSPGLIALVLMAGVELVLVSMLLLFAYECIRMLFTKRTEAQFTRIDKAPGEGSKFRVAYYMIGDTEYPCIFPSEMILNDKMYNKERKCHVLFDRKKGRVLDIWTVITCVLGLIASIIAVIASAWMFSVV